MFSDVIIKYKQRNAHLQPEIPTQSQEKKQRRYRTYSFQFHSSKVIIKIFCIRKEHHLGKKGYLKDEGIRPQGEVSLYEILSMTHPLLPVAWEKYDHYSA